MTKFFTVQNQEGKQSFYSSNAIESVESDIDRHSKVEHSVITLRSGRKINLKESVVQIAERLMNERKNNDNPLFHEHESGFEFFYISSVNEDFNPVKPMHRKDVKVIYRQVGKLDSFEN